MAMAALLIVVGLSAVARGAEVADWPQMGRTAAFESYKSVGLPSLAAPPHPEWTWGAAADRLVASPALWNGTVYLGSDDGHLYALDQDSGERKWSYAQKCQPARSLLCGGNGIRSSPAVDTGDGSIAFGSYDGHAYKVRPHSSAVGAQ